MSWQRLKWYLWQVVPATYRTTYRDARTGQRRLAIWKMWLGRCYGVIDVAVAE